METASTFQAMVAVALITVALVFFVRLLAKIAEAGHPDMPHFQPVAPVRSGGMDPVLLLTILTAAVYEELGSDQFSVTSFVETPSIKEHHWPYKGIPKHFRTDSSPRP